MQSNKNKTIQSTLLRFRFNPLYYDLVLIQFIPTESIFKVNIMLIHTSSPDMELWQNLIQIKFLMIKI